MTDTIKPTQKGNGATARRAPRPAPASDIVETAPPARKAAPARASKPSEGEETTKPAPKAATRVQRASTPPHPSPVPTIQPEGDLDITAPELYLNRELTWLNFNFRVLNEAERESTPLLERIKFIAIVSSNIDEFFMKRIGGLKQQVGAGIHRLTVDGRTPQQQIDECNELVRQLETRKRQVLLRVREQLAEKEILLTTWGGLSKKQQQWTREYYLENIYPLVTPQASDPAHPFPFISNLSLNLLVSLRHPDEATPRLARVKIPVGAGIPRLLKLEGKNHFVRMESVVAHNLDLLFPGMEIEAFSMFRVTRNANTELEEDHADDLLALIETELRERKFAPVVRLEVAAKMDAHRRGMLAAELRVDEHTDVFEVEGMMAMRDLMELRNPDVLQDASLYDRPHRPMDHPELATERNIFHTIRDVGSILLMHPYESYSTSVERFLREASQDPKVRAIKMTLYRTSADSKEIDYLIEAARNGKQVAVMVELKARFDEEANIRWASRLEQVGIHVTYGVVGLKTHCKVILVVRQDYNGLKRYMHVGTGNYHGGTARLYGDIGLLTCDDVIGADLTELLNYLTTGFKPKRNYRKILPAPKILKKAILDKIEREVSQHSDESPGLIQFKMNALEDADVTAALYRAARAGVRIDLFVRDSCRLRPGIPNLSESARVISIVGRFLEHARIYYFKNGGDEEYYIGSADLMMRNLESRVELIVPVEDPRLRDELRFLLDTQLGDQCGAWELQSDGSYVRRSPAKGQQATHSQQTLIEWTEQRFKEATRLRRRQPRVIKTRNVR